MSDTRARAWPRRLLIVTPLLCALLTCCGLPVLRVVGDPFERIREVEPLAVINMESDYSPYQRHAVGRDELVFLRESTLEVYRIDPSLNRLRVVPLTIETDTKIEHLSAFPNSPLAVVYGPTPELLIVNTLTGQVERRISLPSPPDNAIVSPDEHWLALRLPVLTVIDLQTGERFQLATPPGATPGYFGMGFVGPNALFVALADSPDYQLWDLRTRQLRWSRTEPDRDYWAGSVVGNNSQIVTGADRACQVWDVETGRVIRSHRGIRPASAVALHPKTADYIAGYSLSNFALRSGLSGSVRIWNADGERLTTFAAHRDSGEPRVNWMAVSVSGNYLVTAGKETVKVWDYHALLRR